MICRDVEELALLWAEGRTIEVIAQHFGVSRTVVGGWRQQYELPPRRSRFSPVEVNPTPAELEERKREIRERNIAAMRAAT